MSHRYIHKDFETWGDRKAHMTIMESKDKAVHLPIVKGVVSIPDQLHHLVSIGPDWLRYTGQVPSNDEELAPIEDVDAFHNGKKKASK